MGVDSGTKALTIGLSEEPLEGEGTERFLGRRIWAHLGSLWGAIWEQKGSLGAAFESQLVLSWPTGWYQYILCLPKPL